MQYVAEGYKARAAAIFIVIGVFMGLQGTYKLSTLNYPTPDCIVGWSLLLFIGCIILIINIPTVVSPEGFYIMKGEYICQ